MPEKPQNNTLYNLRFIGFGAILACLFFIPENLLANWQNTTQSIFPDTVHIQQILKKGDITRKEKPDSALFYFNQVIDFCTPALKNSAFQKSKNTFYENSSIKAFNNSGHIFYFRCKYDSATFFYEKALELAQKFDNQLQIAEALFNIAEVHLEKGNFDEANQLYLQSMKIYRSLGDAKSVLYCFNSLGIVAKLQGDYNSALENYMQALHLADSLHDELCLADLNNNMGNVYKNRGEYARAMENFDRAYQIFEAKNETLRMSDCLENMGEIMKETGNYLRAIEYYERALVFTENRNDKYRSVGLYKNLGEVKTIISDYGQAKIYFEKAILLAQEIGDRVRLADCFKDYGRFYEKQGDYLKANNYYTDALELAIEFNNRKEMAAINLALAENAIKLGNIDKSISFSEKSFAISREIGALKEESQALKILSDVYMLRNDSSKSYFYYKAFSEVKDTLLAIGQQETIERIEARNQLAEKEKENQLLISKNENQQHIIKLNRTVVLAMSVGVLLLAMVVFLLYKRIQDSRIMFVQKEQINKQKVRELNLELDFKNRELTTKALHLTQNEELIHKIAGRLKTINGNGRTVNIEIETLVRELKVDFQKNNWDEFEHHFQKVHPQFYLNLAKKYPTLSVNEKKICAFLKLNLKTKDISAITGQSVKSIEVARTRLRKKFGLDTSENLDSIINSI